MTLHLLHEIRSDDRRRWALSAAAIVVGVALSLAHWSGLLVAGALVSLPQRTLGRGVAAGFGVGVLVVALFVGRLALAGTVTPVADMGVVAALPVGIGIVLPTVGSLVRGFA